jgi:hypothetical protein
MTNAIAETLRTWALDAQEGELVEVEEAVLNSAADYIDYLCGVIRSLEVADEHKEREIDRLHRELNCKYARRNVA